MSDRIRELLHTVASTDAPHLDRVRGRLTRGERSLESVQREIAEEIAGSLGRAAAKLQAALDQARAIGEELDSLERAPLPSDPDASRALLQMYKEARDAARLRLRNLKIQREALGYRRHEDVDRHYPLPPRRG